MNYFNYFTEIEETFVRRRAKNLLLSPIDWAMIEGWQERGIPLHIVLRSIESVFDGFDKKPGPRTIKGLLYCREEIEAQYQEWISMQAGKSPDAKDRDALQAFSVEAVSQHISNAVKALKASKNKNLREDFERAIARLEELKGDLNADFEAVDNSLTGIEHFLDHALLTKSEKSHLGKVKHEISAQLKNYKAEMEPEAYKKTLNLMILKQLREDENVPRLGLFFL